MKLVLISQNNCTPCQMVKNYLDNEDAEYTEINVSENPNAIQEYSVMSSPTTILFDGDDEVARVSGFSPSDLDVLISQT